jgi:hypothetical protein
VPRAMAINVVWAQRLIRCCKRDGGLLGMGFLDEVRGRAGSMVFQVVQGLLNIQNLAYCRATYRQAPRQTGVHRGDADAWLATVGRWRSCSGSFDRCFCKIWG